MSSLAFHHVDVFTKTPYQGNPAGVLMGVAGFEDRQMLALAREVGLPGNGFLWPAQEGAPSFHIRFFTPQREVSLSGHTTLACAHVLFSITALPTPSPRTLTFRTRSAFLTVEQRDSRLWLTMPLPTLRSYSGAVDEVAAVCNLAARQLRGDLPLQLSPENDLLIPLVDEIDISKVRPDVQAIASLGQSAGIRGFCLFTTHVRDSASHVHSRFFAPHYGVPEDPATGSVHGPLALYMWRHGMVQPGNADVLTLVGEQGEAIGRPSRVYVEVALAGGTPCRVRVGGEAVTVIKGDLSAVP
jgi:PhzF family phenazine biosynthesis protein